MKYVGIVQSLALNQHFPSRFKTSYLDREALGREGYCRHEVQEVEKCLPSMFPLRVHIQLTHLSWPVLITHSVARLKIIAVTRFWWAVGTERESLRPSGRNVTFGVQSPWVWTEASLLHLVRLQTHRLSSPIPEMPALQTGCRASARPNPRSIAGSPWPCPLPPYKEDHQKLQIITE